MRIAIVAGEASGDILGASLIKALQARNPAIEFFGIGGPRMCELGFETLFAMDRLSVMGLIEPLKRLPELLHIRKTIKQTCLERQADLFIGIDSPDFTLNIERYLKQHGMKTVHYVSPSVWAWRQGRIKKIRRSVDLMLTLLPFEAGFYEAHQVPVAFVGHPLADQIAMEPETEAARQLLTVAEGKRIVALMPGSRGGEVALMGDLFLQVAKALQDRVGPCCFLLPAANDDRKAQLEQIIDAADVADLDLRVFDGQSQQIMAASDAILLASGTTALEAMLLKKPMVVAYKMAPFSYAIISRLLKSKYVSLPNLLADDALVPEVLQDAATVDYLTELMEKTLNDSAYREQQVDAFYALHQSIRCNASETAANAILELL